MAEDQPNVNHFHVGGGGQPLHHTDEDGRHDQHVGQIHGEGGFEVDWLLEESGGVGNHHEQDRGQVCGHYLTHDPSFQGYGHMYSFTRFSSVFEVQIPPFNEEKGQFDIFGHLQGFRNQSHSRLITTIHSHPYEANLKYIYS